MKYQSLFSEKNKNTYSEKLSADISTFIFTNFSDGPRQS